MSFDPDLPDPSADNGRFNTGDPNFRYMRQVVQEAIHRPPPPPAPPASTAPEPAAQEDGSAAEETGEDEEATAAPTSLAQSC